MDPSRDAIAASDGLDGRDRLGSGGLEGMGLLRLRIRCAQCGLALQVIRVGTGKAGAVRKGVMVKGQRGVYGIHCFVGRPPKVEPQPVAPGM